MKPRKSALCLSDIQIIASNLIPVAVPDGFTGSLEEPQIDIDFDIFQLKNDESKFKIVVSIDGNAPDNPVPGYCFNIIAEGLFFFDNNISVKPGDKDMLLSRSAIPIVMGHIRAYLAQITSAGPYGKYLLPVFDFNELIQQKSESEKEKQDQN